MMTKIRQLALPDGQTIAYQARAGKGPGILWLGGFKSAMDGTKAEALDIWAAESGQAFLRFDYFGHGLSSGNFRNGTITRWRDDAVAVLDRLTEGPQILVGSSMGAWIALLLARLRPARIAGMLLIAPAVDFTEALLWPHLPDDAKRQILEAGEWMRPSAYDDGPYPITRALIKDGRSHLLFGTSMDLQAPVHILQGMQDPDVPWQHTLRVVDMLAGNVTLTLVKQGDHRLSTPDDIALLLQTLTGLVGRAGRLLSPQPPV